MANEDYQVLRSARDPAGHAVMVDYGRRGEDKLD